jgi:hypothetical protein
LAVLFPNKGVERERAGAVVVYESEFSGVGFWDHSQRHAVHARKQVVSKRGRVPPQSLLFVALLSKENAVSFVFDGAIGLVVSGRVVGRQGLNPRPEPLPQTEEDRVDKGAIGMRSEKGFEGGCIDGGNDFEEFRVVFKGGTLVKGNGVIFWRARNGRVE